MQRFALFLCLIGIASAVSAEFSGNVAIESQTFGESAQFDDQFDNNVTLSAKPKWETIQIALFASGCG